MTAVADAVRALAYTSRGRPRSEAQRQRILAALPLHDVAILEYAARYEWDLWARAKQREPPGSWRWWFLKPGRGFGKSRTAAETTTLRVRRLGEAMAQDRRPRRIGIVGRDATAVREEMVDGPEGLVAVAPAWLRPTYEPSKKRITWPNGVTARTFSADEPDSLRGPNLDWMWLEEISSWRYPEAFHEGADLCLRKVGSQGIITSTPKRVPLVKDLLLGREDAATRRRPGVPPKDVVVTGGSSYENRRNLAAGWFDALLARYEGTNTGRQELHGDLLDDLEGALWSYDVIEQHRVRGTYPALARLVVAVDPTRAELGLGDACGIIVGGVDGTGHAYVLDDLTLHAGPEGWGRAAVAAYHRYRADAIVYEGNFARGLVVEVIKGLDSRIPLREVTASRGKYVRAEPVAALYTQGRVHHVTGDDGMNRLARLEDELCQWSPAAQVKLERSPNRLDGLVWLITDLIVDYVPVPTAAPVSVGTRESHWRAL